MADARKPVLMLLDAMGFVFRAHYAPMDRLTSPTGMPTKVPYLFATMVRKLVKDWHPEFLGVVFDVSGPTFRDALFAEYKAQRPPMPEDLSVQLPYVRRLCEAMRLPILEKQGYEADDVIGALARQAAGKDLDIFIVTADKDMMQLVGGPVRVLNPSKADLIIDAEKVQEILGVPPEKVIDVMALMGDAIDNIPGAKGIGEKGARALIQRFGSVEAALDRAAEVEGKRYREALQQQREQVLLSKKLATIATDVPVLLDLGKLSLRAPDAEALRALYTELGFGRLLRELAETAASVESATLSAEAKADSNVDYATLDSPAALGNFLQAIPRGQEVALWLSIAPGGEDDEGFGSRVAAVEISPRAGVARTVWLDEKGEMLSALREFLSDASRPKIVHDPKLVELLTGPVAGMRHATQLYAYLLRPTTAKHSLPDVIARHLNAALCGAAGESADFLQRLTPPLRAEVETQQLAKLYETMDLPLAFILARMERAGVLVDPAALAKMSATMETEIRSLQTRIFDLAGSEFNVNSPQQLAEILFDKFNLTPSKKVRAKARSTAAEVLEDLALTHELPRLVLDFRELSKLKSTYSDALPKLIHPETRRIHTRLSQTGTATGRLASSTPNLQNIPVRTELGRQIRAAFVAPPGCVLLSADYSQIELRILAHFSQDAVLLDAFRRGEDIHARTAQEVFGAAPFAQTSEHRRAAKAINFGIIYGQSAFGLAQQLGIDQKEAAKFIAAYFERYRGVREYLDRTIEEVRASGCTKTLFGRIRPIPEINSPQMSMRSFAERTALNTPLQGTAADLIKLAMIEIDRQLTSFAQAAAARMILQVHDELLFEVRADALDALKSLVKPAMENVHALAVPLVVDLKVGPNWRDMN
jgi:DNA polymerase-1